jgi:hypothetical protein
MLATTVTVTSTNITNLNATLLLIGESEPGEEEPTTYTCLLGYQKTCGLCIPPPIPAAKYGCQCESCRWNCWGNLGINYSYTPVVEYQPAGWEDLSSEQGVNFGTDYYKNAITYVPAKLPINDIIQSVKNEVKKVTEEVAANSHINGQNDTEEDSNSIFSDYNLDPTKVEDQIQAQKLMQFEAQNAAEKIQSVYIAEILKAIDKELACIWGQLINAVRLVGTAAEQLYKGELVHVYYGIDPVTSKSIVCVEKADCEYPRFVGGLDDPWLDLTEAQQAITPRISGENRRADGYVKFDTIPGAQVTIWTDGLNENVWIVEQDPLDPDLDIDDLSDPYDTGKNYRYEGKRYFLSHNGYASIVAYNGEYQGTQIGGFSQEVGIMHPKGLIFQNFPITVFHYSQEQNV